jgi:hypothetical protein
MRLSGWPTGNNGDGSGQKVCLCFFQVVRVSPSVCSCTVWVSSAASLCSTSVGVGDDKRSNSWANAMERFDRAASISWAYHCFNRTAALSLHQCVLGSSGLGCACGWCGLWMWTVDNLCPLAHACPCHTTLIRPDHTVLRYLHYNQSVITYYHCLTVEQSCRILMAPRDTISHAEECVTTSDAEGQLKPTA